MSKAVDIIDGVLFVHTRHYDDVNRVIICNQKKPYRVFSDDEKKEWSRPHGEWISCEDRLPEENGRFFVFLPDRNGTFMCADFLSGKWYPDDYECTSDRVIAWMPLPEPYKKEGEE